MPLPSSRNLVRRFAAEESGSITVEFVLWLPLLFVLLAGSYIFFDLYRASSKAVKATYTLGDIVSRQVTVDDAFIDDLLPILSASMADNLSGQQVRVSSIQYDADNEVYTVLWSRAVGGGEVLVDGEIPLEIMPAMADLDTVILTETRVPYAPIGGYLIDIETVTYENVITHRPRFVQAIPKV
jgi:hypothetical protein